MTRSGSVARMTVFRHKGTGRWVAQVYDPAIGKRRQVGTFMSKGDARQAEQAAMARPNGNMTCDEWRTEWLKTDSWKESTRVHNRERTQVFSTVHGRKQLRAFNRKLARAWITEHPGTHGQLSAMFGAALYEDDEAGRPLIEFNPFSKLVKRTTAKRDLRSEWLTASDLAGLEETALLVHGPVAGALIASMITFAAETGARPGEIFALTRDKLDAAGGRLLIDCAASSKTRTITTPKNGKSREVVLSKRAAAAAAAAPRFGSSDLVFTTPTGVAFWQPTLSYYWRPVAAAAGRRDMQFYELRHYCATQLLEAGVDESDVGVQLGHSNGQLVREVYGHPSQRAALNRVQDKLDEGSEAA